MKTETEKCPDPQISTNEKINQDHWEYSIKHYMNRFGWLIDVDNETTLGFTYTSKEGVRSSRDYDKKTRRYVHIADLAHEITLHSIKEANDEP